MQAFSDTARVQAVQEGLYFYEQDIVMSKYLFNDNLIMDISLEYNRSGFGIVISEDSYTNPKHSCLFHLGTNSFQAFERHLLQQYEYTATSNILKPEGITKLRFKLIKSKGSLFLLTKDSSQQHEQESLLGEHTVSQAVTTYYVGIYSQAGNLVKDVSFIQGIPDYWHCSIANVHGGRISFVSNGFTFEDCVNDAELEQRNISLPAGTFWFDYETENVNDLFDIEGYVYNSVLPPVPSDTLSSFYDLDRAFYDEDHFEDKGKAFVCNQGAFTLVEPANVIVSFKGRNGKIKNICIKNTDYATYLATDDKARSEDGSYLIIDLSEIKTLSWEGVIYNIPAVSDLTQQIPYSIVETERDKVRLTTLSVNLGESYDYFYDVETGWLTASQDENLVGRKRIKPREVDNNKVKIFSNVNGLISNFIITKEDGTEVNINLQRNYKTFVPGYIDGPIIVTDINKNSFDLSGSYREVIDANNMAIDIFSKSALELKLSHHTWKLGAPLQIFGIPKGAEIDDTQTDIEKFTTAYELIDSTLADIEDNVISVPDAVRNDYEYIGVRYSRVDQFSYLFVVNERELFDGILSELKLSSTVNESGQNIYLYGIPKGCFYPDYFLRVPSAGMISYIDVCATRYTLLATDNFTFNVETNSLTLHLQGDLLDSVFEYYIVDYCKKDSYSVNWNNQGSQYEVDITTDENQMQVHYEMQDNGVSNSIIRTDIVPDESKFIVLKRERDEITDEDQSAET